MFLISFFPINFDFFFFLRIFSKFFFSKQFDFIFPFFCGAFAKVTLFWHKNNKVVHGSFFIGVTSDAPPAKFAKFNQNIVSIGK